MAPRNTRRNQPNTNGRARNRPNTNGRARATASTTKDNDGYPGPYEALESAIAQARQDDSRVSVPPEVKPVLHVRTTAFRDVHDLRLYTYSPDSGPAPDDVVYRKHPWMREHVPRGFSIVVERAPKAEAPAPATATATATVTPATATATPATATATATATAAATATATPAPATATETTLTTTITTAPAPVPAPSTASASQGAVVSVARGPKKFGGITEDDDDDGDRAALPHDEIDAWRAAGLLQIVREDKENGKFALVKMFRHRKGGGGGGGGGGDGEHAAGERLAIVGSKNAHVLISRNSPLPGTKKAPLLLHWDIARLVQNDWEKLEALFDAMLAQHGDVTLIGEYCDGMHFVPLDAENPTPHLKYFGMFDATATALDPLQSLADIARAGVLAVRCDTLDSRLPIAECIKSARCGRGEGSVLYFRNTDTGRCVLAKNKTALYILKRMTREKLMRSNNLFESLLEGLPTRIVSAADYHYLSTDAAARITARLFEFGQWMMTSKIPYKALGFMPINGVRGSLTAVGFATLWKQFTEDPATLTADSDDVVRPEDLGPFNAREYKARVATLIASKFTRSSSLPPPLVVFFQLPQGGGKSTVGNVLRQRLENRGIRAAIVEQDEWYGDTVAAQCYLEHLLRRTDADVVLVTRCNANEKHYAAYLARALRADARVVFMMPRRAAAGAGDKDKGGDDGALGLLAVCLAGVIERSRDGDQLMIGRIEFPKTKAVQIVVDTHGDLRAHGQAIRYDILSKKPSKEADADARLLAAMPVDNKTKLLQYAEKHLEALLAMRRPIEDIVSDLCMEIHSIVTQSSPPSPAFSSHWALVSPKLKDATYVAFVPDRYGQLALESVAQQHGVAKRADKFHCTQAFLGGDLGKRRGKGAAPPPKPKPPALKFQPCAPGTAAALAATHLVIRKADGHAAFRLTAPFRVESDVPHITAYVPARSQAKQSRDVIVAAMGDDGASASSSGKFKVIELESPVQLKAVCEWVTSR